MSEIKEADDLIKMGIDGEPETEFFVSKDSDFIPIRGLRNISEFAISDYIQHCRYLVTALLGSDNLKKELCKFLGAKPEKLQKFVFSSICEIYDLIETDFELQKGGDQLYRCFSLFMFDNVMDKLDEETRASPKKIEEIISLEFQDKKGDLLETISSRMHKKSRLDKISNSKSKLVKNWMSHLVTLEDFSVEETDIGLVSAMRMKSTANLKSFFSHLMLSFERENRSSNQDYQKMERILFFKGIVEVYPLLCQFGFILGSRIRFSYERSN